MVDEVYDISRRGAPVIVASDSYLFTAVKEGASSPFTTKAFQFGRSGDNFTLENAGGTGGDTSADAGRFIYAAASPDKQWFAAVFANSGSPNVSIWKNNFDGTMSYVTAFNELAGVPSALIFSPDSTKLFAVGSGSTSEIVLQYIKLTGSTWASQTTMTATTLTMINPNSISHHPTLDKLLIANGAAGEAMHEVTYDSTSFGTPSESPVGGVSSNNYHQPRYSPNGEYVIYGQFDDTLTPNGRQIRLHKIGVGLVDTLDVASVARDATVFTSDAQWFNDSSHAVFVIDHTGSSSSGDGLILVKRTGDSLSLEQTIDYSADNPSITNISLTQDTFPLLAIGAGDPRADTGGWVVSSERKHLRILKFDSATGLFLTTPVQDFTEGNVAAFAPSSAYPFA